MTVSRPRNFFYHVIFISNNQTEHWKQVWVFLTIHVFNVPKYFYKCTSEHLKIILLLIKMFSVLFYFIIISYFKQDDTHRVFKRHCQEFTEVRYRGSRYVTKTMDCSTVCCRILSVHTRVRVCACVYVLDFNWQKLTKYNVCRKFFERVENNNNNRRWGVKLELLSPQSVFLCILLPFSLLLFYSFSFSLHVLIYLLLLCLLLRLIFIPYFFLSSFILWDF